MPTYSYACKDCGHAFDISQAFTDDALSICPNCGGNLRKVWGSVGVVFKGSGFYRNDSRDADKKKSTSSASASSSSSEGSTSSDASTAKSKESSSSSSSGSSDSSKPASGSTGSTGSSSGSGSSAGSKPAS
ncbi:FmdB family zinc ribbon protein [Allobranchiibius huperziae]|uniref:Putative FmdB family regulatory protein n=1 Tax=Allobranchiibius huperziae TaxID=1874116 RepID=A0A853DFI3_9MICO|nr:putative FmdB family regulatory protein [Allobranchiibius huperziae]